MLQHMTEKFCGRIDEFKASGCPLPMRYLYSCLTTDIITVHVMNRSWNYLESPDLAKFWLETLEILVRFGAITKYCPMVIRVVEAVPVRILRRLDPGTAMFFEYRKVCAIVLCDVSRVVADKDIESSRQYCQCNGWNV
jgi:hypothetical protein